MIRAKTSGKFNSINTYGLALTVGLGTLIILCNVFLESVIRCVQRRRNVAHGGVDRWAEDGLLQVHRSTLVLAEEEEWQNVDGAVPFTQHWRSLARESKPAGAQADKMKVVEEEKRVSVRVDDVDAVRRVDTDRTLASEESEQGEWKDGGGEGKK